MMYDVDLLKENFRKNPFWFRFLNAGWKATYPLGTKLKLDKEDLIRTAKKTTGLSDFGPDFNDEPLDRLLWSINHEANLHPVGRFITRQRYVSLLSIRLRAAYYFKKYPQILEQPLYPAWIIVGLQRTGTTKLQRLLAADPDHRVIPSWEVINPMPLDLNLYQEQFSTPVFSGARQHSPSTVYPKPGDRRIKMANLSVKAVRLISPGFFAVHPIDAIQPEEDILMLDLSFMSTTPEAMMPVPTYASWLERSDQSDAYAYAVKIMKFLQWIHPAKRWVLKTPHHLEFPNLIEKHFGEVHFIWPHRTIYESVPSYLSMLTYNSLMFCEKVDPGQIARHWVRKIGYMLDKALDYRLKDGNGNKFTDLWYHDLISSSIEELSKIYKLDGGLTPDLIRRFQEHEVSHPHRKYGTHHYSLADFNLAQGDIDRHTKRYQDFIAKLYDTHQRP